MDREIEAHDQKVRELAAQNLGSKAAISSKVPITRRRKSLEYAQIGQAKSTLLPSALRRIRKASHSAELGDPNPGQAPN